MQRVDVGCRFMAFVPLVQQQASEFAGNIDRPFPELRLGLSGVAVNAEKYAHAIGRLLIGHTQLMISFDLFDKRLKLFRYDFVHGFVR
jgi:hypothetical protein